MNMRQFIEKSPGYNTKAFWVFGDGKNGFVSYDITGCPVFTSSIYSLETLTLHPSIVELKESELREIEWLKDRGFTGPVQPRLFKDGFEYVGPKEALSLLGSLIEKRQTGRIKTVDVGKRDCLYFGHREWWLCASTTNVVLPRVNFETAVRTIVSFPLINQQKEFKHANVTAKVFEGSQVVQFTTKESCFNLTFEAMREIVQEMEKDK